MLPAPVRQVGLLYDRWRHHRFPPPQFRHGTGGEENVHRSPPLVVLPAAAHKSFGPIDLTSTYSMCTRRVFAGIGHRTQAFRSGVHCTNHGPYTAVCVTHHLIETSAHAPQHPMVTYTGMGAVGLGPHKLLRN
ncbi:uncharacterized protein TNCV_3273431 [Trichonephila clavipes]|nr:uncharacterized protein TNCV_3273431 [Trichonephila clavipes]